MHGRRVAVVYDAPSEPLERAGGWWGRSRAVARFVREHGAKTALVTREGDAEVWRAGEGSGVSFAAAIEAWASRDPEALPSDEATVVVPLDERIYVGEVMDGLVEEELVAVPERAMEKVREGLAARRPVLAFDGGQQAEAVREVVAAEPLPFDPFEHRYRPALAAAVRQGLFHPIYLAAPAVVGAGIAAAVLGLGEAGRDVVPPLIWSLVGAGLFCGALGVLFLLKRELGGFELKPGAWTAPISVIESNALPVEESDYPEPEDEDHGH